MTMAFHEPMQTLFSGDPPKAEPCRRDGMPDDGCFVTTEKVGRMGIVNQGVVFQGEANTDRSSACFPSICVLPTGRWLCAFRISPKKADAFPQNVAVCRSDDEGRSWSTPAQPFHAPPIRGVAGAFRVAQLTALGGRRAAAVLYWVDASDPILPFFNEQTEGLLDSRIFLTFSEDGGENWSTPRLLDTTPYTMPTPITGPILPLANGEWALQFETNKTYHDTSVWRHASVLMFSRDGGRTWPEHVKVFEDPDARFFHWDQRPSVLPDGTILDVFWSFDRGEARYLNIHARSSRDHGRTWSPLWDTGVPGQPAPVVPLSDGKLALVYVDRTTAPKIAIRISRDGGKSWPAATERTIYDSALSAQERNKNTMQDAWSEMSAFSVGLPYTARLGDGDVLAVFYAGPSTHHTAIRWVHIHP